MISFSIIMPTYNQAGYIRRAIASLLSQDFQHWELIIVNDGCTDNTEEFVGEYLSDNRFSYIKNQKNKGLGFALNQGLEKAKFDNIAYLPSDDYYYEDHLSTLAEAFKKSEGAVLIYTRAKSKVQDSVTFRANEDVNGLFKGLSLQLVQTAHKKVSDRWVERSEWVTEDLFKMYWSKLVGAGAFVFVPKETCCWTIHPFQRYRIISEKFGGGLNIYRCFYNVHDPIKLKVSDSKFIDEEEMYKEYRDTKIKSGKGLKILLVGELAYNPERIYALEEQGHELYGLWISSPTFSFSTVGPLPFGHVKDLSYENWEDEIKSLKPDIIYGLLNFGAVQLAYEVLKKNPDIPFVWHFKEGPSICQERGLWNQLMYLYDHADGKIYINPEAKDWYEQFIPSKGLSFILDGDLPKINYFSDDFSSRLSDIDGEVHTVVPGRLIGVSFENIEILANNGIHIHLYVENYLESKQPFITKAMKVASNHFHVHSHCAPRQWVKEFSQYDAGWLHCFDSTNNGCLRYVTWNDLNMPARMNTLAAAGLPMIQKDNTGHIVAMQSHIQKNEMGIFFKSYPDLAEQLNNRQYLNLLRDNVLQKRMEFSFDKHVADLTEFFHQVIRNKNGEE